MSIDVLDVVKNVEKPVIDLKHFTKELEKHLAKKGFQKKKETQRGSEVATVKGKKPLTNEELEVLLSFVKLFSELAQDTKKAPAVTGADTNPVLL